MLASAEGRFGALTNKIRYITPKDQSPTFPDCIKRKKTVRKNKRRTEIGEKKRKGAISEGINIVFLVERPLIGKSRLTLVSTCCRTRRTAWRSTCHTQWSLLLPFTATDQATQPSLPLHDRRSSAASMSGRTLHRQHASS